MMTYMHHYDRHVHTQMLVSEAQVCLMKTMLIHQCNATLVMVLLWLVAMAIAMAAILCTRRDVIRVMVMEAEEALHHHHPDGDQMDHPLMMTKATSRW